MPKRSGPLQKAREFFSQKIDEPQGQILPASRMGRWIGLVASEERGHC